MWPPVLRTYEEIKFCSRNTTLTSIKEVDQKKKLIEILKCSEKLSTNEAFSHQINRQMNASSYEGEPSSCWYFKRIIKKENDLL